LEKDLAGGVPQKVEKASSDQVDKAFGVQPQQSLDQGKTTVSVADVAPQDPGIEVPESLNTGAQPGQEDVREGLKH
jgi:hypothetical protein